MANAPAMDRPSIAFAKFLDSMEVLSGENDDTSLYLTCDQCGGRVCEVEHGDSLRVLLNTALAHEC